MPRPGGRSARVRAAVLGATLALLAERGYEGVELPEVARRAGVHPTTVYRRWGTKAKVVGEALLERSQTLSPTPDTGALRTDLERLLLDGAALVHTPAVRALFEVLLADSANGSEEVAEARDRFWAAHLDEAGRHRRAGGRAIRTTGRNGSGGARRPRHRACPVAPAADGQGSRPERGVGHRDSGHQRVARSPERS